MEQTDEAIDLATGWFGANLQPDGRWLYRYRPATDVIEPGYNIVRHAGVLVALEQAAAAGEAGAAAAADEGWPFVEAHLEPLGDGTAFVDAAPAADTGAAALAAVAWTYRLARQGGAAPEPLHGLGRFLLGQVLPSGAVAAGRDRASGAIIDERSRFYTGEVAWALQRLARALPGTDFDEAARRTLRYLTEDRDQIERWFPAIADHWAAYALADAERSSSIDTLDAATVDAYRRTLAGRFAIQVRWESQRRPGSGFSDLTRARPATAAAVGTLGEGLGQLALTAEPGTWRDGLDRQLTCAAGLLVARQSTAPRARSQPIPTRSAGAWVTGGVTQIDDQQHALSALLLYRQRLAERSPGGNS